jgi:hypothetical protein
MIVYDDALAIPETWKLLVYNEVYS